MPKAQDLPNMIGDGVALPKDKVLDKLGDEFTEVRDKKAKLATELGEIETKIVERMKEKGLTRYRFADQEMIVKEGKIHVRVKTVKLDGVDNEDLENEDD